MAGRIMPEIIVAEHGGRDKAIGAGPIEFDEQPGARGSRNAAFERGSDLICEMGCDQPVGGLAFGRHGAPFGGGDRRRDFGEFLVGAHRQPIRPEMQGEDQGAMDDEIGITADRRGEMRIAAQVETEMAVIVDGIFRLRLSPQHHFIDEMLVVRAFDAAEDAVELRGAENLPLVEFESRLRPEIPQDC